jgi:hypothetical protein
MNDQPTIEPARVTMREAYTLAFVGLPILLLYALAQAGLSFLLGPHQPALKLVIEPYLLLLGLILQVLGGGVSAVFRDHQTPRPYWIAGADCASFVITFWAFGTLVDAFLREAKWM